MNNKDNDQVPPEIVQANNRARVAAIVGAFCAILLVVLEVRDAEWWQIMTVALMAISQIGRASWQRGYSNGYRRGLSAGTGILGGPRSPASGRR